MFKLMLLLNKHKLFMLVSLSGLMHFTYANANECLQVLPINSVEDGIPKVCQSDFTGSKLDYVCQDYRVGEQRYQVLYRGGVTPKAILQVEGNNKYQVMTLNTWKATCHLPAPPGIPSHALHRGIGLCLDQNDKPVPCSIYEHAEARQPARYRHMVFYKTDDKGYGEISIETKVIDSNNDAMAAELAYQIGISLSQTECCANQAIKYLAYAHQLFPHAKVYREAYQHELSILASLN